MDIKIIKIQGNLAKENNLIDKIEIKDKTINKDMETMGIKEIKEIIGIKTMTENIIIKIEGTKTMEAMDIAKSKCKIRINTNKGAIMNIKEVSIRRVPKINLTFNIIIKNSTNRINIMKIILQKIVTIDTKHIGIKDMIFTNTKE
jgi:hypothetical protein